ncbi:MAG: TIGR03086 family protein [Actinobacteria bacterium]|nr:TIGR03086 family protein [Actinomycetota bacterium]
MDVVDLDARAAVSMIAILSGMAPDQFDAPTPCAGWSVRDLVRHVVAGNVKFIAVAEGTPWARGAPDVDLGDDPVRKYRETFDAMIEAWRRPGALELELVLPRGPSKGDAAQFLHLGETLIHGWDLARATGQEPRFDRDVVEASLADYQSWLPPNRPPDAPFGDAMPVPDDAPLIDRFAAFLGRDVSAWSS